MLLKRSRKNNVNETKQTDANANVSCLVSSWKNTAALSGTGDKTSQKTEKRCGQLEKTLGRVTFLFRKEGWLFVGVFGLISVRKASFRFCTEQSEWHIVSRRTWQLSTAVAVAVTHCIKQSCRVFGMILAQKGLSRHLDLHLCQFQMRTGSLCCLLRHNESWCRARRNDASVSVVVFLQIAVFGGFFGQKDVCRPPEPYFGRWKVRNICIYYAS